MLYPDSSGKEIFVSYLRQQVVVQKSFYSWSDARTKCNAVVEEEVEFDWSPSNPALLRDQADTLPKHSLVHRQYYNENGENFKVTKVTILTPGHGIIATQAIAGTYLRNNTFDVYITFHPPVLDKIRVKIHLEIENFLESVSKYNVIHWRPFGPIWEGSKGAFVANVSVAVEIPWGSVERKNSEHKDRLPPGVGYLVIVGLADPIRTWRAESLSVEQKYTVWLSEWERVPGATFGPGFEPLRCDIMFEIQQKQCGSYPYWVYLVAVSSVVVFLTVIMSVVGFLYYETPWRSFLQVCVVEKKIVSWCLCGV